MQNRNKTGLEFNEIALGKKIQKKRKRQLTYLLNFTMLLCNVKNQKNKENQAIKNANKK